MKRFLMILLIFMLVFTFAGCGPTTNIEEKTKLSVVTTVFPGYDFARQVAGDHADVTLLLPPGAESHSFEPTPQDILNIQRCDLFIYVGGESEAWVDGILDTVDTSHMTVISMMDLVDTVPEEIKEGMEEEEEDHDDDSDGHAIEYDEHVWTSPINAIRIVRPIAEILGQLDETNAESYLANMEDYTKELKTLDESFREVVDHARQKTLIFGDRFPFRYFVDEYGLDYYAAFPGCATETEPSAQTVAFLIDKVKEENFPVVFHIEFSNEKMADTICETTKAKKLLLHSCHNVSKDDLKNGVTYLDLMTQNVENLKEALS